MSCIIRQESIATAHCYFKLFFTTSGLYDKNVLKILVTI
ncbi:hypothetical protein SAMN05444364_14221 [Prevotella scopos JCM 17725]|uniref:Uncharacterized protein n=1 Tax=Prevotella scopos JCM 17725 TaxID=1236518 RepID=A0AAX2F6X6_9BACT|nr:hypothetical protein SAMN05444364_14221 [Prevotella scopos JCM 17725]